MEERERKLTERERKLTENKERKRVRIFSEASLPFCFSGRNLPGYTIFRMPTQNLVVTSPPTCSLHITRGHDYF